MYRIYHPIKPIQDVSNYNVGRDSSVGIATRYRLGRSGDRIPVGSRFLPTVQTDPGAHNGYRVCPGGKAAEAWRWPPPRSAEVKERAELYRYYTSGPWWPDQGWPLCLSYLEL
jgi:hypothetical protein